MTILDVGIWKRFLSIDRGVDVKTKDEDAWGRGSEEGMISFHSCVDLWAVHSAEWKAEQGKDRCK